MTESKALERSMKAAMQVCLESREETISSRTFSVAVMHPWPGRNPDCKLDRMLLEVKKWLSCLCTSFSKTLARHGRMEIGL